MELDTLTKHIANQTMELKDVNTCLSFVSLIWRDQPVMVVFDNLNRKIVNTFFDAVYQGGDLLCLEKMIDKFLK